jgi:hypothetical protein
MAAWITTAVLAVACPKPEEIPDPDAREACAEVHPNRSLLWGDLHVHTSLSFDAYTIEVRNSPADAYRFAKGEVVEIPGGDGSQRQVQLERPLDFAAVTDHAEFLGEVAGCVDPDSVVYDLDFCQLFRTAGVDAQSRLGFMTSTTNPVRLPELCADTGYDCRAAAGPVWRGIQEAAEEAYDRSSACTFTSFVGYEWSGTPGINNFHRNIIFKGAQVPPRITSYFEEPNPKGLWTALDAQCLNADFPCDVLAIPHDGNLSAGMLFHTDGSLSAEDAALRAAMEPLIEIYQHKADSECRNDLSGLQGAPDEFCDWEKFPLVDPSTDDCGEGTGTLGMIGSGCVSRYDYLRGQLLAGMAEEQRLGVNPYKLGVIASTDTHNGTPGLVQERGWPGHIGSMEDTPAERLDISSLRPVGLVNGPGGLAAVWAESNDRPAIFEALRRRETYGTSGPRISLRFFGGWDLPGDLCERSDLVEQGYARGVPMGGTLETPPPLDTLPTFAALATRDPGTANHPGSPLQRLQIIKLYIDSDGQWQTEVHDVAGGANGATVDEATCNPQGAGADSLCAVWSDPDWNPDEPSAYYVRVLENPTCRWSTWECLELDPDQRPAGCEDPRIPKTIQERAWSSAIWVE